jgi:hypothetical protein
VSTLVEAPGKETNPLNRAQVPCLLLGPASPLLNFHIFQITHPTQ